MRLLIVLAFLLFSPTSLGEEKTSDVTVLHVNTKWNKHQNIDLNGLIGCKVKYGFLEDQSKTKDVYVYCKGGMRSLKAALILDQSKIRSTNIIGGIIAWAEEIDKTMPIY